MNWVLMLWLASAPGVLTPLGWYATERECAAARRAEVVSNLAAGARGGIRYECMIQREESR
jgi:hypothetical protein